MPVELALAGVTWPWSLRADRELDGFARRRPWLSQGASLSLSTPADPANTVDMVRRAVYEWDRAQSEVRVVVIDIASGDELPGVLGRWLGVEFSAQSELARALGRDLDHRATVFIIGVHCAAAASRCLDHAEELREWVLKLDHLRGPSFVVLHRGPGGIARGSSSADFGWPVGLASHLLSVEMAEVWPLYIHLRIAWETAGCLDDATECSALFPRLSCGDDEGVENTLNNFAHARFSRLPSAVRDEARRLGGAVFRRSTTGEARITLGPVGYRTTAAPWVARALLLHGVDVPLQRSLRGELVCKPLVQCLLSACSELEARLRGHLGGFRLDTPDENACAAFIRYSDGKMRSLERELYPACHPSPPRDSWDFASLGALLRAVRGNVPELLSVRNALAHGHYAGWSALLSVRTLGERGILREA